MDLTSFTNKKKEKQNSEIILQNDEIIITKINGQVEFQFKKKDAIEKYQDFLFLSPTHAIETSSEEEAQQFFEKSMEKGVEGLMFKNLQAEYKPGLRSGAMAKLKETKEDLDLVVVGAEYGRGKRAGFYSSFIVAVKNEDFNDETDKFLELGKVSSGIKELEVSGGVSLDTITKLLTPLKKYEKDNIVYFEPKIVIQVRYQEIQKSPTYNSGFALRFPRIIMLREDKSIDEINSIEDVESFI